MIDLIGAKKCMFTAAYLIQIHNYMLDVHMFDFFFEYVLNDLPPSRNRSISNKFMYK